METCLVHPMASLLSAYGMGLADIRATRTQAVEAELDATSRLAAAALLDALGVARRWPRSRRRGWRRRGSG